MTSLIYRRKWKRAWNQFKAIDETLTAADSIILLRRRALGVDVGDDWLGLVNGGTNDNRRAVFGEGPERKRLFTLNLSIRQTKDWDYFTRATPVKIRRTDSKIVSYVFAQERMLTKKNGILNEHSLEKRRKWENERRAFQWKIESNEEHERSEDNYKARALKHITVTLVDKRKSRVSCLPEYHH